jgi:D-tyrosyl-tRNA(Tyr) deacylase
MRAVVQRVKQASVSVEGDVVGSIAEGLCALVGVGEGDDEGDAEQLARKVSRLRVFTDAEGKMNLSLAETGGAVLAVSQFTLFGDVRRGQRPSFSAAMEPTRAHQLFEAFCDGLRGEGLPVQTGRFRASMQVTLVNDGPVTILIDTKKAF